MKKSRFTDSQIVVVLKEGDAAVPVTQLVRKHAIGSVTHYAWRSKYAVVGVSDRKRIRDLEAENAKLKPMPTWCGTRWWCQRGSRRSRFGMPRAAFGLAEPCRL